MGQEKLQKQDWRRSTAENKVAGDHDVRSGTKLNVNVRIGTSEGLLLDNLVTVHIVNLKSCLE